jgi:magnesium-transporting ATPase (P-type)
MWLGSRFKYKLPTVYIQCGVCIQKSVSVYIIQRDLVQMEFGKCIASGVLVNLYTFVTIWFFLSAFVGCCIYSIILWKCLLFVVDFAIVNILSLLLVCIWKAIKFTFAWKDLEEWLWCLNVEFVSLCGNRSEVLRSLEVIW